MTANHHQWALAARLSVFAAIVVPLAGCVCHRDRADLGLGPVLHPDNGAHRSVFVNPVGARYPDLYVHPVPAILHQSLQRDARPTYPGLQLTPPAAAPPAAPGAPTPATGAQSPHANLWMRPSPPAAQQPTHPQKTGAVGQDTQKTPVLLPVDQRRPERATVAGVQPTVTVVDEDASASGRPTTDGRRVGVQ